MQIVWHDNKVEVYQDKGLWDKKVIYVVIYYGHGWLTVDGLPIELKKPFTIVFCETLPEKIEHD